MPFNSANSKKQLLRYRFLPDVFVNSIILEIEIRNDQYKIVGMEFHSPIMLEAVSVHLDDILFQQMN